MTVRFLNVAERELDLAIAYYEEKEAGLGIRFYSEVKNSLNRITAFPKAWYKLSENTRRCRTRVFPYGLIYQIKNDAILIVAVAHLKRKPAYWKDRIGVNK